MLLFAKAERDIWRLIDSVVVGANARWQYSLPTPGGGNYLYIAAAQREQQISSRYSARPALVLSHASARIVRILSAPLQVHPTPLDMGRVSCAEGTSKLDSVIVVNPGNQPGSITDGYFLDPSSGFRVVRPQPVSATIPAGDSSAIVIEYRIQAGRFGIQSDTLVLVGGTPSAVIARVPVRIRVDSAGVIVTATGDSRAISAIDFAETCRGTTKKLTFALRLVGTTAATVQRIATGSTLFSVTPPTKFTLNPGDTIHLRLQAIPPDVGDYFDTLTISVDLCNQTLKLPLRVRGVASRIVSIGDDGRGNVDFGNVRVGATRTIRVGVLNPSTSDSVIVLPTYQPQQPYSWQTVPPRLSFPRAIQAGDTLWIDITFAPIAMGIARDSLIVTTAQFGATCPDTLRLLLVGQGTLSAVVPRKAMIDFGVVSCGAQRDTLWLLNTGNSDATVEFPATISGSDATYFRIVEQPLSGLYALRPGDSVRLIVEVRIDPQNNDGIKTATLELSVRDVAEPLRISLQVQQQALVLEFSPEPYVLVDVPVNFTSQSQPPLTVRNLSSLEACIADIRVTRPEIVPLIRTITVPPYSASRDIYFNITPTTLNPIDDTVTIVLSCPCVDSIKVPIRIVPTNNALAITPRPLDFGTLPPCSTARRTLTLKNNDPSSSAELEEVAIIGHDAKLFRITGSPWATLPYSVPSGFSFTVEIEFSPAGTRAGPKAAALSIRYIINGQEIRDTDPARR